MSTITGDGAASPPGPISATITAPNHSSVQANLDDLRLLAQVLGTVSSSAQTGSDTALGVSWHLPAASIALSPGTAASCAAGSFDVSTDLISISLEASVLSTLLLHCVEGYEGAEKSAAERMLTIAAPANLAAGLVGTAMAFFQARGGDRAAEPTLDPRWNYL